MPSVCQECRGLGLAGRRDQLVIDASIELTGRVTVSQAHRAWGLVGNWLQRKNMNPRAKTKGMEQSRSKVLFQSGDEKL